MYLLIIIFKKSEFMAAQRARPILLTERFLVSMRTEMFREIIDIPYGGFFSRITNFANLAEKFVIREIYFLEF